MVLLALLLVPLPATARPLVVATIAPLHSLATAVAGADAEVRLLLPRGASAHSHQLRPSEARMLSNADLVLWIGQPLEGYLVRALSTLAGGRVVSVVDDPAIELLPAQAAGAHPPGAHGAPEGSSTGAPDAAHPAFGIDPHLWMDPLNAGRIVSRVATELGTIDPPHAERYRRNATLARGRLSRLHRELDARLETVRERPFVAVHDAFGYFSRRYRLHSVGALLTSPERRPGAHTVRRLRQAIARSNARCVITEPGMRAGAERPLGATGARTRELDPLGGGLDLGPDLYFQMMRANTAALIECLER